MAIHHDGSAISTHPARGQTSRISRRFGARLRIARRRRTTVSCRADRARRRRRRPAGLSKAARNRLRSRQGNRRRQGHDGACDTLLIRRSSEFIKIFGTSSLKQAAGALAPRRSGSGPRQNTFKRVGDKNPGADQTHHRCEHLEHCEHPLRPRACATKRRASPHSQKDFERRPHNRRQLGFWRNRCAKTGRLRLRAWRKSND